VLHYLGGLMLPVVAIALLHLQHTRAERRDYWQRVVDFKRIRLRRYAVILLTPSACTALSALCDRLLGGRGAVLNAASSFMHQPFGIVRFVMFTLVSGLTAPPC
jgi:CAAX protease family protein